MVYGDLAQKARQSISGVESLMKWPKEAVKQWGPWVIYSLFLPILLWEELWGLPNNATLSAWLLILITSGAVVSSVLFEKRLWCRHLCPIGGMNGEHSLIDREQ